MDTGRRIPGPETLPFDHGAYRALFEQASDGIFIADLDGRYVEVNAAACRMLGRTREDLIGKRITDIIPKEESARLGSSRSRMLHGSIEVDEWVLLHADGHWVPVEVSAKILPDGRWQAFVRDVSERKAAEEKERLLRDELSRANRDLEARLQELTQAHEKIRTLTGLLPVCAWCGLIRDDDREGRWTRFEEYVEAHSSAEVTHGICPTCADKFGMHPRRVRSASR